MAANSHRYPLGAGSIKPAIVIPVSGNRGATLDWLNILAGQSSKHFHPCFDEYGPSELPPREMDFFGFITYCRMSHAVFASTCNAAADEGSTHLLLLNNDRPLGPTS